MKEFIIGIILIIVMLFIFCLIRISSIADEREVKNERKNKKNK